MSENKKYLVYTKGFQKGFGIQSPTVRLIDNLEEVSDKEIVDNLVTIYEVSKEIKVSLSRTIAEKEL